MAPLCDKVYNTKFNLKRHVNCHHFKVKKHICDVCRRQFSSNQNLVEHMYLHSGKKPFTCHVCKEKFRQASQLSLHKRSHHRGFTSPLPPAPESTNSKASSPTDN